MRLAERPALRSLTGSDPATYAQHPLHAAAPAYPETNCYTDIIIELLHAAGHEPLAMLGHLVRMDFEGDQWTFFKPPPEDLERLFAVDIHEMQPYRPLPAMIAEQLEVGRTIIVELDSFHLPDTASTSYRTEHVKSSVAADAIDHDGERLWYFHNAGLFELSGEDYRRALRLEPLHPDVLPPYTELVRLDAGEALRGETLRAAARETLARHLLRRPAANPFARFGAQLERELPALLEGGLEDFHAYAFATVRMAGAAFQLAAAHARWLLDAEGEPAAAAMDELVAGCKAMSFRLARRAPFATAPRIEKLATAWDRAMAELADHVI
ncbi:MAG: DUF1839 family protein [Solirubrobacterales bacterium]|nr:DUF1839 family protein [Solirubrobacterales bacterium]